MALFGGFSIASPVIVDAAYADGRRADLHLLQCLRDLGEQLADDDPAGGLSRLHI